MSAVIHTFPGEEAAASALAKLLGVPCRTVEVHRFPDGEILPVVPACAPTTIVYRSLAQPNDKLVELMLAQQAWRANGARRLVLVAPYLCYMRQDTAFAPGQPVSQKVLGALLGQRFDRVLTVDAHLHRTHSLQDVFPNIEAQNLSATRSIAEWLSANHPDVTQVIGPDAESEQWVADVADVIGRPHATFSKERRGDSDVVLTPPANLHAPLNKVALVDDVCSTGGTLAAAIAQLKQAGAAEIVVCVTHALFDGNIERRLRDAGASEIVCTDAVAHPAARIPLAPILADALRAEIA